MVRTGGSVKQALEPLALRWNQSRRRLRLKHATAPIRPREYRIRTVGVENPLEVGNRPVDVVGRIRTCSCS
jgi:hypothetical protein